MLTGSSEISSVLQLHYMSYISTHSVKGNREEKLKQVQLKLLEIDTFGGRRVKPPIKLTEGHPQTDSPATSRYVSAVQNGELRGLLN